MPGYFQPHLRRWLAGLPQPVDHAEQAMLLIQQSLFLSEQY